jgi:hypothetical protein
LYFRQFGSILEFILFQKFYSHTSWIESGKTAIADLLNPGIPVAANTTNTCDNTCVDDCTNNIITNELTSGYFPFHNPEDNKCFHGGSNDDVYSGINKDTTSACYSPHYTLHKAAADMAIEVSGLPFTSTLIPKLD